MPTIDLTTPPRAPVGLLDALPRRVSLTLSELRFVAGRAGGAPLPFDLQEHDEAPVLEGRLGPMASADEAAAYRTALGTLRDPVDTLERRGLLSDGHVDNGIIGAVGLLATPTLALDLDVVADAAQAKAWHRQSGGAVATLSTADGIVFELTWFANDHWPAELGRIAVIPEDLVLRDSAVPDGIDLPYELLDAAVEAAHGRRTDLLPVLVAQHSGMVRDGDRRPLPDAEVVAALTALESETQGRLRALVADVSSTATTVVGVVSWVLLADGWRALRPHQEGSLARITLRRAEPDGLAPDLAPVLAEVSS